MPFNLLLLPFLGGYWFLRWSHRFRFTLARLDTQRLLFASATAGVVLLVAATLAVAGLRVIVPGASGWWHALSPFAHSGKAAGALCLGLVTPWMANRFTWSPAPVVGGRVRQALLRGWNALGRWGDTAHWARASIRMHGQEIEHVLLRSHDHATPIMATLGTGKVYVGMAERNENLEVERRYLRLIPFVSGHREKDTHNVVFTTDYSDVRTQADDPDSPFYGLLAKDFDIVIPLSEIKTLHLFDLSVFETFQAQRAA